MTTETAAYDYKATREIQGGDVMCLRGVWRTVDWVEGGPSGRSFVIHFADALTKEGHIEMFERNHAFRVQVKG